MIKNESDGFKRSKLESSSREENPMICPVRLTQMRQAKDPLGRLYWKCPCCGGEHL